MLKLMGNVLGDQKVICYEENKNIHKIKQGYIEVLIDVQEDLWLHFFKYIEEEAHNVHKKQNECFIGSTNPYCISCKGK